MTCERKAVCEEIPERLQVIKMDGFLKNAPRVVNYDVII